MCLLGGALASNEKRRWLIAENGDLNILVNYDTVLSKSPLSPSVFRNAW